MSDRSRRTRTLFAGITAGGALAIGAPAGLAAAAPAANEVPADTPGHAVGRPNLDNPAPGLRAVQTVGDQVFNDGTPINEALDGSPLGTGYHTVFGTRGDLRFDEEDGVYYYTEGTGEEGLYKGVLNMPPGNVIGDAVPLRECNFERDPATLAPRVSIRAQCN
jgi:hypothetical protein